MAQIFQFIGLTVQVIQWYKKNAIFLDGKNMNSFRKDSQIDFSTRNVKWTLWGWGVLRVDIIGIKSIFSRRLVIIKPLISIKNGTNVFLLT